MMAKNRQSRATSAEVERLRARPAEAKKALKTIRLGEGNGIAVDDPNGRLVSPPQNADQPYRILAERMSEGAASMTADGTILFCNQRLSDMLGYSPDKLVGTAVASLVADRDRQRFQQLMLAALKDATRAEVQFQRKNGSLLPVLASLNVIPFEPSLGLCDALSERSRLGCLW